MVPLYHQQVCSQLLSKFHPILSEFDSSQSTEESAVCCQPCHTLCGCSGLIFCYLPFDWSLSTSIRGQDALSLPSHLTNYAIAWLFRRERGEYLEAHV
jgi:hypothetical protein